VIPSSARGLAWIVMPRINGGSSGVVCWLRAFALSPQTGSRSILSRTSHPSNTCPKTVCKLFKCGCCSYKMKNCDCDDGERQGQAHKERQKTSDQRRASTSSSHRLGNPKPGTYRNPCGLVDHRQLIHLQNATHALMRRRQETHLVRVGASVGHGESAAPVVQVVGMEFVGERDLIAPDRRFLARDCRRISSLLRDLNGQKKERRGE
jgi:hypothetical protein